MSPHRCFHNLFCNRTLRWDYPIATSGGHMPSLKSYLTLSAVVFAIVALAHLTRAIAGWTIVIGPWTVPVALSWIGAVAAAALSGWAFSLARRK
jgi:hypothetical protein